MGPLNPSSENIHNAEKTLYIGIKAYSRAFTTIGKQTNKSCKIMWTQFMKCVAILSGCLKRIY